MKNKIDNRKTNMISYCVRTIFLVIIVGLISTGAYAQDVISISTKTIKGLVRNAHTKLPISAAQVNLFDKTASASTDEHGQFQIKVQTSSINNVIVVTAYDYGRRDIPLQGRDSIIVDLYADAFGSFYKLISGITGKLENSQLIPSIKTITDINQPMSVSVDDVLQSELGGDVRTISRSGLAGMGSSLFIRGINTLNSNAQPLFVIDGVIWNNMYDRQSIHDGFFNNPLVNIDINDIESVSLVKDGASIYGSKAANGVIIVKTKRGKDIVTKINVNVINGITSAPGTTPTMGSNEFRIYASDLLNSAGVLPAYVSGFEFLQNDKTKSSYNTYHNNTNWANQVYQTGVNKNYSLNVSGGDENAMYYLSVGYTGNSGVVKTTSMDRINTIFNADIKMSGKLALGVNVGFTSVNRDLLDDGVGYYTSPTWLSQIKSPFLSPFAYTDAGTQTLDYADADIFNVGNPYGIILNSLNKTKEYYFNVGVTPTYEFSKNLKLSSQFNYSLNKYTERYFRPMGVAASVELLDLGTSENMLSSQVMRNNTIFSDTRLTWNKTFNKYHHMNVLLGTRYLYNNYESDYEEGHNTGSNNVTTLSAGLKYLKVSGINDPSITLSNYLSADYNFANKYFLNISTAMDGSSRFGHQTKGGISLFGNSWGIFPSIQGGWVVTSEQFMKNVDFINFLKLRVGFSVTGNDDIKNNQSVGYFSPVQFLGRANGLVIANIENPEIQWETTRRGNVGVDMNLFNERLSLSVDAYSGITSDLLTMKSLPDITGGDFYWINEGTLSNSGFEVSINAKVLNFKNLKWELGFSAGHYVNEITSLPSGKYTTSLLNAEILLAVGQPIGSFYGYKTLGVFATQAEASVANNGTGYLQLLNTDGTLSNFGAGDVHFDDYNHDGLIDNNDRQVIGNPNPDLYGTLSNKFLVKRFTLSALFTYSYGNDVFNYQRSQLESGSMLINQSTVMLNRWTAEGQHTLQPRAEYGDPMGNARFSDRWIEDGSYLRLKTVSLSYDIPLKSKFIEGFNIWISANNLYTFTKYLGLDPENAIGNEVYAQGIDAGLLPLTKSYYVGLRINL